MRATLLVAAGLLAAVPAFASEKTDALAAIDQYVQIFNKSDAKAFAAMCLDNTIIIDNVPPNIFQGANACTDWWKALEQLSASQGMTDGVVSHGKLAHFDLAGDRAYAVFPSAYKFKLKGKAKTDKGMWSFALQKTAGSWRIAGWSWAATNP